jgi:hypothetical protein
VKSTSDSSWSQYKDVYLWDLSTIKEPRRIKPESDFKIVKQQKLESFTTTQYSECQTESHDVNLVEARRINPGGNNKVFIFHHVSISPHNPRPEVPQRFIGKEFGENQEELDAYEHLAPLQGVHIPRCFGYIQWIDERGMIHQGIAIEFLNRFRELCAASKRSNRFIFEKCKEAIEAISSLGVLHGDLAF